jgi:hypothetical protein
MNTLTPNPVVREATLASPDEAWAISQRAKLGLERDAFARMLDRSTEAKSANSPVPSGAHNEPREPVHSGADALNAIATNKQRLHVDTQNGSMPSKSERPPAMFATAYSPDMDQTSLMAPMSLQPRLSRNAAFETALKPPMPRQPTEIAQRLPYGVHVNVGDGTANVAVRRIGDETEVRLGVMALLDELGIRPGVVKINGISNAAADKGE